MSQAACESNEARQSLPKRPDWSRGAHTVFPRARGDTTDVHGPLQRLLEDALIEATARAEASVANRRQSVKHSRRCDKRSDSRQER